MSEKTILLNLTKEDFADQFEMLTKRFTQLTDEEINSAIARRKYREDTYMDNVLDDVLDEQDVVYIHTAQECSELLDYDIIAWDELLALSTEYDKIELMWYVDAHGELCCDFIVGGQWEHYSFRIINPRLDPYDAMIAELSIIDRSISRQQIDASTTKLGREILNRYNWRKTLREMEQVHDNEENCFME